VNIALQPPPQAMPVVLPAVPRLAKFNRSPAWLVGLFAHQGIKPAPIVIERYSLLHFHVAEKETRIFSHFLISKGYDYDKNYF